MCPFLIASIPGDKKKVQFTTLQDTSEKNDIKSTI